MTVPTPPPSHHARSSPPAARMPDAFGLADDDGEPLRPWERPAPQAHNAGITPGWKHLLHENKPATRGDVVRRVGTLRRETENAVRTLADQNGQLQDRIAAIEAALSALKEEAASAIEKLAARTAALEARNAALEAEREEFAAAVQKLACRITELEARDTATAPRPAVRGGRS